MALWAIVLFGLAGALAWSVPMQSGWAFGAAILALALPLAIQFSYVAALRRAHYLKLFEPAGWLHRVLSGTALRLVVSVLLALGLATALLIRLAGGQVLDWAFAALALPVFILVSRWVRGRAARQVAEFYRPALVTAIARPATALLLLAAYGATVLWGLDLLSGALAQRATPALTPPALVVAEILSVSENWRALENFATGQLARMGELGRGAAIALALLGNAALFFGAASLAAFATLAPRDWLRALARADDPAPHPRPRTGAIAWITAIAVFATAFLYFPTIAALEARLQAVEPAQRPSAHLKTLVERVGAKTYAPGTIAAVEAARRRHELAGRDPTGELTVAVTIGFDRVEANVDGFLDWYYSLPAEYARIAHLLAGDFESYMSTKLDEHLSAGDPFADLDALMQLGAAEDDSRRLAFQIEAARILDRAEIASPQGPLLVTRQTDLDPLLESGFRGRFGATRDMFRTRAAVAGGSAGLAGLVVYLMTKKIAAKGIAKLAAKAAVKVAASKTASGGAGATIGGIAGGALGSIVPGLGTAAGAAAGAALGAILVGVGVDALMLELEETLSRDSLRADLLEPIRAAREELIALIGQSQADFAVD